jgi:hypothetical protein
MKIFDFVFLKQEEGGWVGMDTRGFEQLKSDIIRDVYAHAQITARIAASHARVQQLVELPNVLSRLGVDNWFSIFKHMTDTMDIYRCSRVCRAWREAIVKYRFALATTSTAYLTVCLSLELDSCDYSLALSCCTNVQQIFISLLPRAGWKAIKMLEDLLRKCAGTNQMTVFRNHRAFLGSITDEMTLVTCDFVLVDAVPYDYYEVCFTARQTAIHLYLMKCVEVSVKVSDKTIGKCTIELVAEQPPKVN